MRVRRKEEDKTRVTYRFQDPCAITWAISTRLLAIIHPQQHLYLHLPSMILLSMNCYAAHSPHINTICCAQACGAVPPGWHCPSVLRGPGGPGPGPVRSHAEGP